MPITTCDSPETLKAEIDAVRKKVVLNETEDTWDTIAQGILHLTRLCNSGGCEFPSEVVSGMRLMSRPLNSALNSERSRLSGAAIELLMALVSGLGSSFEPLVSQFVPTLLALCGRTNKVFASRAKACVLAIVQQTRLPSMLPYFAELATHKSVFLRLTAAEAILACLNCFNPPDLEKETRARIVEDFIKLTARDASADVRKISKEIFKSYELLMPARVNSFVAPLTPVVKKYLDIPPGPSGVGVHVVSSNQGQKQTSRPSSRANNPVAEVGQRLAASTHPKPSIRPPTDGSAHNTRQRPLAHAVPAVVDIRPPRQRTMSQMQRDPPQPRNLHINVQPSGAPQRCAVPISAPAHQVVRHPLPGATRVPPARNVSSTTGPQRPPPMHIKFNPSLDRLKVTRNGAKRIPLPSVPVNENSSEQVAATAKSADQIGSTVDQLPSRRRAEAAVSGKSAVGRKASEGIRSASFTTKPINESVLKGPAPAQHSHKPPGKSEPSKLNKTVSHQRPVGNMQKVTRPLVKAERKETSPVLIPLPPSPSTRATEIPLPPSPDCTPHATDLEAQDDPVITTVSASTDSTETQLGPAESRQEQEDTGNPTTPITTLLSSIQRGFLFTPSSPLSPPQNYLAVSPGNSPERQNTIIVSDLIKVPLAKAPFRVPHEGDSAVDGLNRHALKDLN